MINVCAYIFCICQISLFKISVGTLEIPARFVMFTERYKTANF